MPIRHAGLKTATATAAAILPLALLPAILLLLLILPAALACAGPQPQSGSGSPPQPAATATADRLNVVTTVSPITSIVENIGGARIQLRGIVPEGVNSHTFEPAPSVAATLAAADLIFLNGLFLEEPTLEMAQANLKPGADIISLGDRAVSPDQWRFDFSFPAAAGHPNPHLWPDPILAQRYAQIVRDELTRRDPPNAAAYAANYDAFAARIAALDAAIRAAVASIPPDSRKLLTYHDSWAYFAERYGMTVIGAVQPSDFSEPSARDVADLIRQLRSENVPAVFGSQVFPSDVMETIAAEAGAAFIDDLSDDDLPGKPGDPRHSYLGLAVSNMEIMLPALGGDASPLQNVDVSPVFAAPSDAVYPQ